MRKLICLIAITCLFIYAAFANLAVQRVRADTIWTVTKVADTNDGVCDADCSLREAIQVAEPSGDTIVFAPDLAGQTIMLESYLPIQKSLTIDGSSLASHVRVSGHNAVQIFLITADDLVVSFSGFDIVDGLASYTGFGGAIYIFSTGTTVNVNAVNFSGNNSPTGHSGASGLGGAIYSQGAATTVNVHNSTFTHNGTASPTNGGAIFNAYLVLNVTGSTFDSNASGVDSVGGAIDNYGGFAQVTNSTFSANNSGEEDGAAIYSSGYMVIKNSTLSGNTGSSGSFHNDGTAEVYNSIIANTLGGPDCIGNEFLKHTGNLIEASFGCSDPVTSLDPMLAPLANNGGPTQTFAFSVGSPAYNAGDNFNCASTDQRGVPRPQDGVCDIGAYELQDTPPSVTISSAAPNPTNSLPIPVTITFSEAVTGFEVGDLTVGNGFAGNFSGSGAVYSAEITPAADGLVTVDVAAGVARDSAGHGNTPASQFSITYDATHPGVVITSTLPNPTNISPITMTITFAENVTGFAVGDLTVGNGTAGNFSGSGSVYSAEITPAADGLVSVDVAAGVASDAAGNGNTAASQFSIIYDHTPPTAALNSLPDNSHLTFLVSWSGDDALSGIAHFEVQLQRDGGAWTAWQSHTTTTSAEFTGVVGSRYAFRVRAVDSAGNTGEWSQAMDTLVSSWIYMPVVLTPP